MAATVLIVDDHPGFRAAARRLLELEGYVVVGEAADGMTALDAVHELRPEVVLLDVQLPDIDGFEVAERLSGNGVHAGGGAHLEPRGQRLRSLPRPHPRVRVPPQGRALGRGDRGYPACVKLAIIGGGGFRVPLVYGALLERRPFDEVVLHDVDPERLDRIAQVLEGQAAEHGDQLPFRTTTDLDDALEGAGFVFVAIRVGGLEGRTVDEGVPLGQGVLGQETIGAGGICFALRTIPAMVDLAERTVRRAPGAWLINFTNPAGMVTEALQQVVGDRAVGICDTPSGLCRRVAAALGGSPERLRFDYFGLNHLGWLHGVHDASGDRLPELLADDAALERLEEGAGVRPRVAALARHDPERVPYYFYFAERDRRRAGGASARRLPARAAGRVLRRPPANARRRRSRAGGRPRTSATGRTWPRPATATRAPRTTLTSRAATRPRRSPSSRRSPRAPARSAILNVANRSALPFLDEHAVVEVPCVVGAAGIRPIAVGPVPDHARALIDTVKAVERTTIEAALTGSTALAVKALALHPLVPSVEAARAIFAGYRERLPALEERFA